ncbi:MAG: hypothetical protein R3Y07_04910 [Eubacteriales bacterium]
MMKKIPSNYYSDLLILKNLLQTSHITPKIANTIAEQLAEEYGEQVIYLW